MRGEERNDNLPTATCRAARDHTVAGRLETREVELREKSVEGTTAPHQDGRRLGRLVMPATRLRWLSKQETVATGRTASRAKPLIVAIGLLRSRVAP